MEKDSIKAFVLHLKNLSIRLSIKSGELVIKSPKGKMTPELFGELKRRKADLISYLSDAYIDKENRIPLTIKKDSYNLSNSQKRIWLLSQIEESSIAYNMPFHMSFQGIFNIENFKKAIYLVIDRHEILRTVFKETGNGEIHQNILSTDELAFNVDYKDYRTLVNVKDKVTNYIQNDSYMPFDLENGPLLRLGILQMTEDDYVFYFNMHHIITDGWSDDVLERDIMAYYKAIEKGEEAKLPDLRIQYKDYAEWQLGELKNKRYKIHKDYWLDKLSGELPYLSFPSQKLRPKIMTHIGHEFESSIGPKVTKLFKAYCNENKGSLFIGLIATWSILFYKYTSQKDIVIGTPVAGRNNIDFENQIGCYLNTLVLRNQINEDEKVSDYFNRVKDATIEAYSHQDYPFDKLVEDLDLKYNSSRNPVFDVMIKLQNHEESEDGIAFENNSQDSIIDNGFSSVKFDINITFFERGDILCFNIEYNTDVYDSYIIKDLIKNYKVLLSKILENTEEKVKALKILDKEEEKRILKSFNDTNKSYSKNKTLVNLIEERSELTPDKIGFIDESNSITYKNLNESSNQLGWYLKEIGIAKGSYVCIHMSRSISLIEGVLGAIKTGAAYFPIEPTVPDERKVQILNNLNVKVIITDSIHLNSVLDFSSEMSKGVYIICLGDIPLVNHKIAKHEIVTYLPEIQNKSNKNLGLSILPSDEAYVIFTSGSTGVPKGVVVQHNPVINLIEWVNKTYNVTSEDKLLMVASISFDLSVYDVFGMINAGGTVRIASHNELKTPEALCSIIQEEFITFWDSAPAALVQLMPLLLSQNVKAAKSALRLVFLSGDWIPLTLPKDLKYCFPDVEVVALGGATEAVIWSNHYLISDINPLWRSIPYGKPIQNAKYYILDSSLLPCPIGVEGDLYIGGEVLAKEYKNDIELTKSKFLSSPFNQGERIYKAGDRACYFLDGNIEFRGRLDEQVKIRGYRIELGDVKQAIEEHKLVKNAFIVTKGEKEERQLVAYYTLESEVNVTELRSFISKKIPDYMIPSFMISLDEFPVTINGKIDRKSLPEPGNIILSDNVYFPPTTKEEKILASVWKKILNQDRISIKDSFYNLGGDSIKSIQVISQLKQTGFTIKVEHILRSPILEEQSLFVEKNKRVIDQRMVVGEIELTPIQHWFFDNQSIKDKHHFNQSVLLKSKTKIDHELLKECIKYLARHHDVLRMTAKLDNNVWKLYNQGKSDNNFLVEFYDFEQEVNGVELMGEIGEKLQSNIDIEKGPLFKVVHFRLNDGDRIALILHHLIVDGVSWRIIMDDLSTLYSELKLNKKPKLPLKTDSFKNWASLQKKYSNQISLLSEVPYWESLCSQNIPKLSKEIGVSKGIVYDESCSFSLNKEMTNVLLTKANEAYNTEINDLLMSALGLALKDVFNVEKSILKIESHGREDIIPDIDISRTIGWFTSMYPFVLNIPSSNLIENIIHVKEDIRKIPKKGVGYGILKYLNDDFIENITPSIVYNYLGDFGDTIDKESDSFLEYSNEYIGNETSNNNLDDELLSITSIIISGELEISIEFSKLNFEKSIINRLLSVYNEKILEIIKALETVGDKYKTPSDFSYKELSIEKLSIINIDNKIQDIYKLSPLQEGVFYHWLSDNKSPMYFEQNSYRVFFPNLDVNLVNKAYDILIERYPVLRTSFRSDISDDSIQIVHNSVSGEFNYHEFSGTKEELDEYLEILKIDDRKRGFNLEEPHQMRLCLVKIPEENYEFIWSNHHILIDGWCMSILINDFYQILDSLINDIPYQLPQPPLYSTYINWLDKLDKKSSENYWKEYLRDYSDIAEVPFQIIGYENKDYLGKEESFIIEGELLEKVKVFCKQNNVTLNIIIQAVWGYLLSVYNNTEDVVFGAVVSGRPPELDNVVNIVGLFINTIPIRVKYELNQTPAELIKALQKESISSISHHYLSLADVQSQSDLGMDLINHIIVYENYLETELETSEVKQSEDVTMQMTESSFDRINYDFSVVIYPNELILNIEMIYNANKYHEKGVIKLKKQFYSLVNQFVRGVNQPLNVIDLLSSNEKHELLYDLNDTKVSYPKEETLVSLFEKQVQRAPNNIAVVFEDNELTYLELDELSNQLAHYLINNYDIKPDDLISLMLERDQWMIVAILGILKSGGAYVPIDLDYPESKKKFIIKDSNSKVVIDSNELNKIKKEQNSQNKTAPNIDLKSNNLAYIIYTSGSTGDSKGCMLEHQGVINRLYWEWDRFDYTTTDSILQMTTITFDVSVSEILKPLCWGAKVVCCRKEWMFDPNELINQIDKHKITCINLVPSLFQEILNEISKNTSISEKLKSLRLIVAGGEEMTADILSQWKQEIPNIQLLNFYGPTETSICSTYYEFDGNEPLIPIGKPINNTSIYILDESNNLKVKGVVGEICIGGAGLAKGYLNNPELTSEKFINNPFVKGERIYKTGDLGRWLLDGNIEFLGRIDDQVKIHGYRIELGEIRIALNKHDLILDSVVLAKEMESGSKNLVAFVKCSEKLDLTSARNFLKDLIPSYMIPSYFVEIEEVPLMPNGKIDKKELNSLAISSMDTGRKHIAPKNEIEQKLAILWGEMLGLDLDKISINDSFFELGGNSIKLMKMIFVINQEYELGVSIDILFKYDTIESFSKWVKVFYNIEGSYFSHEVEL